MSGKLGTMIKEARTAKGLTQAALAEQAGIPASDVGKIERGEKEPDQAVLKLMAKALGVTQKSLLEAAAGTGTSGGKASSTGKKGSSAGKKTSTGKKTSSAGKTASTGKTSSAGKTSTTGKTSSAGKTSAAGKKAADVGTLTATEKKLVQLYRKADSSTKKAAMQVLSGEGNLLEILGPLVLGKKEVSSMASGLFETLLSGKTGAQGGLTKGMTEEEPPSPETL